MEHHKVEDQKKIIRQDCQNAAVLATTLIDRLAGELAVAEQERDENSRALGSVQIRLQQVEAERDQLRMNLAKAIEEKRETPKATLYSVLVAILLQREEIVDHLFPCCQSIARTNLIAREAGMFYIGLGVHDRKRLIRWVGERG